MPSVLTLVLGTLPWLALNFSISAGLHYSASFRSAFADGSEGDWQRVVENGLAPLGITWFPLLQLRRGWRTLALLGLWHVRSPWREIEVAVV